ncbi:hypothetical protein C8A06_1160 [Microbacteriaceae bacterium MWH-Ta3]|nr:hypothetical protein C8A06_1160 [Microbacteriaceae bacterium MWH-Ta3]
MRKGVAFATVAVAATVALTGCATDVEATPTDTPTPTPTASETTAPVVDNGTFTMPSDCTSILPQDRVDSLEAEGIILLAGPGGLYGLELITDPTPEMLAGGISCYFGYDNVDVNQLKIYSVVSVAPVTEDSAASITADLVSQGMNESTDDAGNPTFSILGDKDSNVPAIYNLVTAEAWISVISIYGGETFYKENVVIAGEALDAAYN